MQRSERVRQNAQKLADTKPADKAVFISKDNNGKTNYHAFDKIAFSKLDKRTIEVLWNPFEAPKEEKK